MRTKLVAGLTGWAAVWATLGGVEAANFPGTPITPTIYEVTVKKVELCTGSDGVGSCAGALVLGSGNKSFDIAAVGAGAAVGSYANLANLPVGTTFTHVRVTVDAQIVVRASGTDTNNGAPGPCSTGAGGGGSASAATTATFPAAAPVNATVFVPHVGNYSIGGGVTALAESDFQTTGARGYIKRPNDADVLITYSLTAPYTPALNQIPSVTVKFDVTGAVGVLFTGACEMFPEPPSVNITIQ
ncbi:MAG: hypothetical protein ACK4UO_10605 [Pseudolabrys sp.]